MDISVVVNTRDRPDRLRLLLSSLARQRELPGRLEVVVVDDGSDLDLSPALTGHGDLVVRPVRQPPRGRSAARNRGIQEAAYEVVLCVDDDVLFDTGFVAAHAARHAGTGSVVVVGDRYNTFVSDLAAPRHRAAVDSALSGDWAAVQRLSRRDYYAAQTLKLFDRDPHGSPVPWICFVTRNVSFRRAEADRAGGLDEGFAQWGLEDVEFGLRLHRAGVPYVYEPRARVYHLETPLAVTKLDELRVSLRHFTAKHPGAESAAFEGFLFGRVSLEELCAAATGGDRDRFAGRDGLTYFTTQR